MKEILLTGFLLFFIVRLSGQTVLDVQLDFTAENRALSEVLFDLSDLTDLNITFSPELIPSDQKITLHVEDKPLRQVLRKCLADTEVGFKIYEGGILLYKKVPVRYTLSGYITDVKTGERLIGANILEVNEMTGASTNAYGFFSHETVRGRKLLRISYLGYQTKTTELDLQQNQILNIALEPSFTLEEVIISAKTDSLQEKQSGQETTLSLEKLAHLPTVGGEPDVMRYIRLLPGVQSGADGFGGLHVRGGNGDQNLILLDDVPVYNPSHTFGLFSIFNPALVKSVKFYKGGFPARYDGRISSVADIRTREGNTRKFSGEASVGLMIGKAIVEIPLNKGKGGVLLSGRRTHLNPWLIPLSSNQKARNEEYGLTLYNFSDYNLKAHYTFGQKDRLYLSYYLGRDRFTDVTSNEPDFVFIEEEENPELVSFYATDNVTDWGNDIISVRWNHLYSDKLFSNTTFTYSNFFYFSQSGLESELSFNETDFAALRTSSFYSSNITDSSVRTDFDYYLNGNHTLRFGGGFIRRIFTPGLNEFELTGSDLDSLIIPVTVNNFEDFDDILTNEFNLYFSDEYNRGKWTLRTGLHLAAFGSSERVDFIPQPRLSAVYRLNKKLRFDLSAGRTAQFLHLVTKTDSGLPDDLWVPAGAESPPQKAWQAAFGASGTPLNNMRWSVELYAKHMNNLLRIKESAFDDISGELADGLQIDANNREEITEKGIGKAYGTELTLERQHGKLTGWLGYTFAVSNRFYNGEKTRYAYDSRHGISAAITYRLNQAINFSAAWIFQSGRPLNVSAARQPNVPFSGILEEGDISSESGVLPAYHRLDAGCNFIWGKKRFKHKLHLGIYNAYNRRNILFAYPFFAAPDTEPNGYGATYALPVLPSVSYSVKF